MVDGFECGSRRTDRVRIARIDHAIARSATARSARILTEAADAVLAMSADVVGAAPVFGAVAETLMQSAAVQELLVVDTASSVEIGDRLGALAIGLVDARSRIADIRTNVPRMHVSSRTARWLTAVSLELIEACGRDMEVDDARISIRIDARDGVLLMVASATPSNARPSRHLAIVRWLVVAMGGHLAETPGRYERRVSITLPCLLGRITSK